MLAASTSSLTDAMPQMLIVLGVVGLGVLLTISIRGKIARRNAGRPSAREQIERIKAAAVGRRTSEPAPSAEVIERAHELAAQLDNKAERLEQLLQEADEKISMLSLALADTDDELRSNVEDETDEIRPAESADSAGLPAPDVSRDLGVRSRGAELDPLTRSVYGLADAGRTPVEIARALDEQVGKVQLILALRQR